MLLIIGNLVNTKNLKLALILLITLLLGFLLMAPQVGAFFLPDLIKDIKNVFVKDTDKQSLTIESKISLAEDGDVNTNGEIDPGDIVTFSFIITNGTDKQLPLSKIKTNIPRDQLNFIHNIKGATGLDEKTLEFSNIFLQPSTKSEISFDARINYLTEGEKDLSVLGEINNEKGEKLAQSIKSEIKVKAKANNNQKLNTLSREKQENNPPSHQLVTPNKEASSEVEEQIDE